MLKIIKDKDPIWETDKFDVILIGTSIYNQLNGGFQSKIKYKYPIVDEKNRETKYADFSKLDVPSIAYMENAYGKLPYKSSKPVVIGRNGAYAVGTGQDAKFYLANGKQISEAAFKENCPGIYKSVKGEA